jgi:hypothetical protein
MRTIGRGWTARAILIAASTLWGCADAPTRPLDTRGGHLTAVKFWEALASTRWNLRATELLQGTVSDDLPLGVPAPPNGQAWASRMLTYLSLAQYRAALAASVPSSSSAQTNRPEIPRVSSAVASASFTVLISFFGARSELSEPIRQQIVDFLTRKFDEDARAPGFIASGERIGRNVAEAVLAKAAGDRYLAVPIPPRPTEPGYWVPSGATVRSLYGVKPFFLEPNEFPFVPESESGDFLQAPPPPDIGSQALRDRAADVYAIVTVLPLELRAAQVEIARKWNKVAPAGPFTAGEWNRVADELIELHDRGEADAARILAYANAAAFDAQIDCFATKFKYWLPRPSQVDDRITPFLAFAIPNHPSYPSAHSCISSAFGAVLSHEFPSKREWLDDQVEEAGMSRVFAGIHYLFDIVAGHDIGKRSAAKALAGSLE